MIITKETFDKYRKEFYPNFLFHEITCSCCGKLEPKTTLNEFIVFMTALQSIRKVLNKPLTLSSAWRCEHHELNILGKKTVGMHNIMAVDIRCAYAFSFDVLDEVMARPEFRGIGISQKGDPSKRFIHIDSREVKALWSY